MTLTWPDDVPHDQEGTRRAREDLLVDGLLAHPVRVAGVREVIERSWRRCVGDSVPTRRQAIPYLDPADLQPRLRDAAAPVLDRFREYLGEVRVAMFLSDASGRIVMRRAGERTQLRTYDKACAAEGFDFSEGSIGTNGLGTVARERGPLLVHGSEHYNEDLEVLTCAGTPLFEPFTRQLIGTFALACHAVDATPLMCALATDVGRQIEGNLTAMLGAHERTLVHSYLLATRGDRDPVIVVTERSAFANSAGLNHVSAEAHALLWMHLSEAGLRRGRHLLRVPLPSGWRDAVVEHVDDGSPARSAYCVRLVAAPVPQETPARRTVAAAVTARTPQSPAPARSPARHLHPLQDVNEQLDAVLRQGECLVFDGPPGSGKRHVAVSALAGHTGAAPVVVDCAEGTSTVVGFLDSAIRADHGAVVCHLQDLSPRAVNRVKALVERAPAVALTADLDSADDHIRALGAQLGTTVRLPALQEMPAQVPRFVTAFLDELSGDERRTRFSSDALQLLMRWSWPGNIAELRRTVVHLARRMPGRTVHVLDLPARMQQPRPRGIGLMESAERDAIVTALRRSGGNRTKAAAALGIGRTTLYRKLQAHHIDG